MSERKEPAPADEGEESEDRSVVSRNDPGSDVDTREIPMLKDDESQLPRPVEGGTVLRVPAGGVNPDSLDVTRKVTKGVDEFDSDVRDPAPKAGSDEETVAMSREELAAKNNAGEWEAPEDEPPEPEGSEDETVLASRPPELAGDLETREVPTMREEWRERAAQAAQALGETGEVAGEWGSEEGDASLAHSVAAASGQLPVPDDEKPAAIAGSVLELAREAQRDWARLSFEKRAPRFDALRNELVGQRADYVPSIATAIGRPMVETLAGEYIPVLEALRLIQDVFHPLLSDRHAVDAPLAAEGLAASVRMVPWGVVAVSCPASTPFAFPMTMAIDAMAAGNAAVICASQQHPRVNEMMRKMFHRAGFPEHLVQFVNGDHESLLAIVNAAPDKFFHYGSEEIAPRLAAHTVAHGGAFEQLSPGKDTLVVLESAPLDRAVHAALWGSFAGAGLLPGSIERVVVAAAIYDEFRMRFIEAARGMNSHHAQLASMSESFSPRRFQALMDDAVAGGARVTWPAGEHPGRWIHWKAAVIENLSPKAKLNSERIEGPAVVLHRADDPVYELGPLLRAAPASSLSVFGKPDAAQRVRIELLPVGRVLYQDVFPTNTPGGGWPLGPDLPRTSCNPLAMLRPRVIGEGNPVAGRVGWYPYTDDKAYALMDAIEALYGLAPSKRIKAAVKLALNPQKRRILRGDNS